MRKSSSVRLVAIVVHNGLFQTYIRAGNRLWKLGAYNNNMVAVPVDKDKDGPLLEGLKTGRSIEMPLEKLIKSLGKDITKVCDPLAHQRIRPGNSNEAVIFGRLKDKKFRSYTDIVTKTYIT